MGCSGVVTRNAFPSLTVSRRLASRRVLFPISTRSYREASADNLALHPRDAEAGSTSIGIVP